MLFTNISTWIEDIKLFDIQMINLNDSAELLIRFCFNSLVLFTLIKILYARNSNRKDFFFSYFAIGITVFLLCFLLESVKLELGFALGLFAVFGIIRYRTDAIPIKEMTYLFVVIGISVINALANKKISYTELLVTNLAIITAIYILEKILRLRQENSKEIIYEKIGNVHLDKEPELLDDLKARTGIAIKRFEVRKIDFLHDTAKITIFYDANGSFSKKI